MDLVFRIAGDGGEGVISTGELLTLALSRSGYEIYTFRTYPPEIKGGNASFQVRTSEDVILSQGDMVDVLVCFNKEAFEKHIKDIKPAGVILYDSNSFSPEIPKTNIGYPIEFGLIAAEKTGIRLTKNIVALGVIAGCFGLSIEILEQLIKERFLRKGSESVDSNLKAVRAGFEHSKKIIKKDVMHVGCSNKKAKEFVLSGNESLALGAIAAGLRIYAGYPITPATDIMEFLARELPKLGGHVIQTEDEIAAMGVVFGSSFAGAKSMTATSGPGLALSSEMIGLGVMAEIPSVIVDVQRVGPSTGMPTKTEQGDLYISVYGGHGSSPRVVMALTSVEDCFYGIIRAFNISEEFQTPVIVLSDQYLGHRKATIKRPDISEVVLKNRIMPDASELSGGYKRYRITPNGISSMSIPSIEGGYYIASGVEHDETGYPAGSDHENHFRMTQKRYSKFHAVEDISNELVRQYGVEKPDIGIIGWGSSEGVIREAVQMAIDKGYSVGAMHPKIIYPLPIVRLKEFIQTCKALIVPEVNFTGQFATLLRKRFTRDFVQLNKTVGLPFTPVEIFNKIAEVASNVR